ncbi:hypothetical protein HCN44_001777 [Aphidius gifuensis]|uniref:Uncharacterized protein n=1 Tax=Aphidius gifuensis TaxID=684658 RepID=A0A834XVN0_APHGI|nr:transport and Golgi organization 2 homolog [Aphidius gifuensis]KAF7992452.1 hypothetical protein HCN44_001777 [Aphidius gifuensis]
MCILFIYRNPNADSSSYRLIIATNRDEYYNRPTKSAHFWDNHANCLGGTDEEPGRQGGTWLGLSKNNKKLGILLNLKESQPEDSTNSPATSKKGRGFIVNNFITSSKSATNYLNELYDDHKTKQSYNSFTLVTVNFSNIDVNYFSNSIKTQGPEKCDDVIIGFGNSVYNRPYKKVTNGKEIFKSIVNNAKVHEEDQLIEKLFQFLQLKEQHLPDEELESTHPNEFERLSSIFINGNENYGTRTHTLIFLDTNNHLTFIENTKENEIWSQQRFDMLLSV